METIWIDENNWFEKIRPVDRACAYARKDSYNFVRVKVGAYDYDCSDVVLEAKNTSWYLTDNGDEGLVFYFRYVMRNYVICRYDGVVEDSSLTFTKNGLRSYIACLQLQARNVNSLVYQERRSAIEAVKQRLCFNLDAWRPHGTDIVDKKNFGRFCEVVKDTGKYVADRASVYSRGWRNF